MPDNGRSADSFNERWMPSVQRLIPSPDPTTAPFWDAARRGELCIQRCLFCRKSVFYPRAVCPHCGSSELKWEPREGTGVVYSFSVVWKPAHPGMASAVPYVVALVDIDDGARLMTNLVDCDPEQVHVGMKVRVVFERLSDEISIPLFKPAS